MVRFLTRGAAAGAVLLVLLSACSSAPPAEQAERIHAGRPLKPAPTDEQLRQRIIASGGDVSPGGVPSVRPGRGAAGAITDAVAKMPDNVIIVAPYGTPNGDGSWARPADLATVLSRKGVPNGEDVLLRGGRYKGSYVSNLSGTSERPVMVRSFPGEWAVLDPGSTRRTALSVRGSSSIFKDIEVAHTHRAGSDGFMPERFLNGTGIEVVGDNVALLGLVVHDNSTGIELSENAKGAHVNGSLVYNNGYLARGRAHGEGISVEVGSGKKRIENTFVFNNFAEGIAVSDFDDASSGIGLTGNTVFGNGTPGRGLVENLAISDGAARHVRLDNNVFFHQRPEGRNVAIGRQGASNGGAVLNGNAIVGGEDVLSMSDWKDLDLSSNFLVRARGSDPKRPAFELRTPGLFDAPVPKSYRFDANRYLDVAHDAKTFALNADPDRASSRALTFKEWVRDTGLDASSSHSDRVDVPARAYVRSDLFVPGRASVTVVNPSASSTVRVDLRDAGLSKGSSFEIRDVQDPKGGVVASGTYTGAPIELDMHLERAVQPIGDHDAVSHTPADLGTFVLTTVR
jgi:hypothetical protein